VETNSNDLTKTYMFDGDQVLGYDDASKLVSWDDNGQQTSQLSVIPSDYELEYDWDGRLRKGLLGSANRRIEAKYTPDGARVTKKKIWDGATVYNHKYIVDPAGKVPTVLLVLDADNNNAIVKTYVHADNQVIAQHDGDYTADKYFYLHDRLGSVRLVINADGDVNNVYTYDPWGMPVGDETQETISNMYRFAGYVWDSEVSQYHCFRRQYDPVLARFTSRDPVQGSFEEPMTLHVYLYCLDDPINQTDPTGSIPVPPIFEAIVDAYNDRNADISRAVSSGDAWQMAENLTAVQNYYAIDVMKRKLADVAFGAIHCVAQARGQFFNDVTACGIQSAFNTFIGLFLPEPFALVYTLETTDDTFECLQKAEAKYGQSILQCGSE